MNKGKNIQTKGIVMTLMGGTLWGFSGSCGQFLFQYREVTSDWLVSIRLLTAGALILLGLFLKDRGRVLDVWKSGRDRAEILLFGVMGMMMCQYSYFTTIQYSNAAIATVLQYTGPALILVYLCIRELRLPMRYEVEALCCSMLGTFVLATHGNFRGLAIPTKAFVWGMISAVALVAYTLLPGRLMKKYSTLLTLGWGMLIGGLVLMGCMRPWRLSPIVDGRTVFLMAIIILIGTILAFYLYLSGVQMVGAANASMLACIEPLSATVISAAWLKVQIQPMDLLGFVFVIAAVFIISLNKRKQEA